MIKCIKCLVDMTSEGYIEDKIPLCHACYENEYNESAVYCGDCLVPLEQCAHAANYKRGR